MTPLSLIDLNVLPLGRMANTLLPNLELDEDVDFVFLDVMDRQVAWLLSDATPEPVSRLNNVRSCCVCSVNAISKVPTRS